MERIGREEFAGIVVIDSENYLCYTVITNANY